MKAESAEPLHRAAAVDKTQNSAKLGLVVCVKKRGRGSNGPKFEMVICGVTNFTNNFKKRKYTITQTITAVKTLYKKR